MSEGSENYFSAWQEKLESLGEWICLLDPQTGHLWRNRAWREFLDRPALVTWSKEELLVDVAGFAKLDDAVSRALKQGLVTALVLPLLICPLGHRFAISVGRLYYAQDGHYALVMLHVTNL